MDIVPLTIQVKLALAGRESITQSLGTPNQAQVELDADWPSFEGLHSQLGPHGICLLHAHAITVSALFPASVTIIILPAPLPIPVSIPVSVPVPIPAHPKKELLNVGTVAGR